MNRIITNLHLMLSLLLFFLPTELKDQYFKHFEWEKRWWEENVEGINRRERNLAIFATFSSATVCCLAFRSIRFPQFLTFWKEFFFSYFFPKDKNFFISSVKTALFHTFQIPSPIFKAWVFIIIISSLFSFNRKVTVKISM